jgi:hypothetical protein
MALTRRRSLLLRDLAPLSDEDLCTEVAALQWEMVIDAASMVPKGGPERTTALRTLEASESILDRYAARLAREWGTP